MKLAISQAGRVHRATCRHSCSAHVWVWADDKSRELVAAAVVQNGFGVCQHCRPFSIERDQQEARK